MKSKFVIAPQSVATSSMLKKTKGQTVHIDNGEVRARAPTIIVGTDANDQRWIMLSLDGKIKAAYKDMYDSELLLMRYES